MENISFYADDTNLFHENTNTINKDTPVLSQADV
jgi:hypothetical protein